MLSYGTYGTKILMQITIDMEAPSPPFAQLIEQVKQAIRADRLQPGDPLPSIRQLASDLDLNNKTVAKAYRLLERDAVIQSRGYRGTFVHPEGKQNCAVDMNAWAAEKLGEVIALLRDSGVTSPEINTAFRSAMSERSGD